MTGHTLAQGLSAWRPASRSLHTTDLLHRFCGSSSTGNSTLPLPLVITFRMKWARRSNLRRMISLDRNPCFAEGNRPSAKASRLRLSATAESASPRERPLRRRARGLCHAARSSGQLDLPRQPLPGVPECLEASRLRSMLSPSGVAWRWPCFNWVWPTRSCVTGFRDLATCAAWADHDTVTTPGLVRGVDLPELAGNGAWLDGRAARVPDSTLHEPDDDNLANREWPVPVWCATV